MSDIVRRLRKWAERWPDELNTATLVTEAANRIEALESDYHNLVGNASLDHVGLQFAVRRIEQLETELKNRLPESTKRD